MLLPSDPGRGVFHSRWDIEIIALGLMGECRFGDFQRRLGISRKVLSERLRQLVAEDFFERRLYQARPPRYEYRLTPKGKALRVAIAAMAAWVREWRPGLEDSWLIEPHE
ncbi:helix-turn-helix domain-containing protein [Nocardioides sp. LS1]|uniref:winged helix-turn-helix transcriptional regulator n=1 Tax=Nocardioides sp. LS1 TaxID=1027620 RepID=UPI000F6235F3|nr:helix-turn-helix domain-containing protein [Nocardioides sp. LS1]GCD88181.1 hypothetical protein NLS1_01870 [Nocardioides sp. LS1]